MKNQQRADDLCFVPTAATVRLCEGDEFSGPLR